MKPTLQKNGVPATAALASEDCNGCGRCRRLREMLRPPRQPIATRLSSTAK